MSAGQVSPDGKWMWDGNAWIPATHQVPYHPSPHAPLSVESQAQPISPLLHAPPPHTPKSQDTQPQLHHRKDLGVGILPINDYIHRWFDTLAKKGPSIERDKMETPASIISLFVIGFLVILGEKNGVPMALTIIAILLLCGAILGVGIFLTKLGVISQPVLENDTPVEVNSVLEIDAPVEVNIQRAVAMAEKLASQRSAWRPDMSPLAWIAVLLLLSVGSGFMVMAILAPILVLMMGSFGLTIFLMVAVMITKDENEDLNRLDEIREMSGLKKKGVMHLEPRGWVLPPPPPEGMNPDIYLPDEKGLLLEHPGSIGTKKAEIGSFRLLLFTIAIFIVVQGVSRLVLGENFWIPMFIIPLLWMGVEFFIYSRRIQLMDMPVSLIRSVAVGTALVSGQMRKASRVSPSSDQSAAFILHDGTGGLDVDISTFSIDPEEFTLSDEGPCTIKGTVVIKSLEERGNIPSSGQSSLLVIKGHKGDFEHPSIIRNGTPLTMRISGLLDALFVPGLLLLLDLMILPFVIL